jgi:multiple sugar transport system substrate-binding protein
MKRSVWTIAVIVMAVVAASCAQKAETSDSPQKQAPVVQNQAPASENASPAKEVDLTAFTSVPFADNDFKLLVADPLSKKYPNVKITLIKQQTIDQLVAAGQAPDLIFTWNAGISQFYDLDLIANQDGLMKANRMDSARFDKNVIQALSDSKGIIAVPYQLQLNALYYNKDIFDKFGVGYPKDGLTWEDTIGLAEKLSRTEDGIDYRGFEPGGIRRIQYTRSLAVVDSKTEKAHANQEDFKTIFNLLDRIYSIPNNQPVKFNAYNYSMDFIKTKNVAMMAGWNLFSTLVNAKDLNWDAAQYPSYKETPNQFAAVDVQAVFVTKSSAHKDDAMKVIEVLTSDDVQKLAAQKLGFMTPLSNESIRNALSQYEGLNGKNLKGVLKSKPAPAPVYTKYESNAQKLLDTAFEQFFTKKLDLNTALRQMEEQINTDIATDKSKSTAK